MIARRSQRARDDVRRQFLNPKREEAAKCTSGNLNGSSGFGAARLDVDTSFGPGRWPAAAMADDVLSRALLETERALDSSITRALAEGGRDSAAVAGCASSDDDSDVEAARGATSALASMQEELYRANETALEKLAASRRAAADRRDAALAKVTAYRAGRELQIEVDSADF